MKLEIGDVVEFKKYEDMNDDERMMIDKELFPLSGKVKEINVNNCDGYFSIVGSPYIFSKGSVAKVVGNNIDVNDLNIGDEILVKATVKEVFNGFLKVNSSIDKTDVVDILKRKEPEHFLFIVKEDYYGMYIGTAQKLVNDKSKAKIYTSRNTANEDAADMHLNAWDVIPYGD